MLAALTIWGASRLAFLCDDAFIHFRYAANLYEGRGIVWNPAPFAPVEGAGFLWVIVLATIWSLTGVAPPEAANPFSMLCGVVQLALLATALARVRDRDGRALPFVAWLCAMLALVGNRTFLQWLSSGLDTALFNMWLFWWTLHAFRGPGRRDARWLAWWSLAAALATMTRPDGLPLTCATAGVAGWLVLRRELPLRSALLGLAPLLLVVGLTLWRRAYYGDWLPNTYYAKVVAAWPEAGARYFACFAVENGTWLWLPIVVAWSIDAARRLGASFRAVLAHAPAAAAVAVVLFNTSYYLFKVGGDHFEYRVLSPLAALGTVACVAMAARLGRGARLPVATALALLLAGGVGWLHLAWTREPTYFGIRAVTPAAPAALKPLARWFDRQQLWLFARYICLRCVHHDIALQIYSGAHPARQNVATPEIPFPVLATGAVGVPGWVMADGVIIDEFGLNDWVIARAPLRPLQPLASGVLERAVAAADTDADGWLDYQALQVAFGTANGVPPGDAAGALRFMLDTFADERPGQMSVQQVLEAGPLIDAERRMAHDRAPPPGYVEAFEPNVTITPAGVVVRPRKVPLTAERVREIEAEWRARVLRGELGG
ncbi:MAG: hypothetical protein H6835_20990 [Planctomycetes bacterium]|nr:hypothetical protein [Planctomycetota bacterium]